MKILDKYRVTVTKNGLRLDAGAEQNFARIDLDAQETLELRQLIAGRSDLLLAGVCPGFDFNTRQYPCPSCRSSVRLEQDGIRWRGYCGNCTYSFELSASGEMMTKLRNEKAVRGKR